MTGFEFKRQFDRQVGKTYSNFYNTTKLNDLFRKSLIVSLENSYKNLVKQDVYDNISSIIRTNQVFALNSNRIYESPVPISLIVPSASPTSITTAISHNLIDGDLVFLSGVAGTISTINGAFYAVTVTGDKTFTVPFNSAALVYTANTGQIAQHQSSTSIPKLIPDYQHLLTIKFKYNQAIPNIRITDATNAQPITITLSTRNNNVKTGDRITNSGVFGNSNANGTYYVKKLGALKYQLFVDGDLTQAVSGNGNYTGGGRIDRPIYHYAVPLFSYRKISNYDKPTVFVPAFERAENFIKAEPRDVVCQEATIDYLSTSMVFIISTDTSIELEDYYNLDFLYQVMNKASELFFQETKDFSSMQAEEAEQVKNQ